MLRQANHARLGTGGLDQALDGVVDECGVAVEYHLVENGGDESVSIDPFELVKRLSDAREAGFCTSFERQVKQESGRYLERSDLT